MCQRFLQAHPFFYAPPNTQTTAHIGFQVHSMLEEFKPKVTTHSPHGQYKQRAIQPSVEMFCIQKTPHCPVTIVLNSWGPDCNSRQHKHTLRIEAHNCTKCIKVFSKPTHFSMYCQIHK